MNRPDNPADEPSPAARLSAAQQAEDWVTAIGIIEQHWSALIVEDPIRIREAVHSLPESIVQQNPRWVAAQNYLDYLPMGDKPGPVRYRDSTPAAPTAGLFDMLVGLTSRCASRRSSGDFARAARCVDEAREALADASDESLVELQHSLPDLYFQWGKAREFNGQNPLALQEYQDAYDLAVVTGNVLMMASSAGSSAFLHALAGRTGDAERWLGRMPAGDKGWHTPRYSTTANLARALLHLDRLEYDAAERVLHDDIDIAQSPEYWAALLLLEARLVHKTGDPWRMLSDIDSAAASRPSAMSTSGVNVAYLSIARAEMFLALKQPARARAVLVTGHQLHSAAIMIDLELAKVEFVLGEIDSADRIVESLLPDATAVPRVLTGGLLLRSVMRLRQRLPLEAAELFTQSMMLESEHRLLSAPTMIPRADWDRVSTLPGSVADAELIATIEREGGFVAVPETFAPLSPRERSVLTELSTGVTIAELAARRFVSQNTVKSQLRSIYRKLGVASGKDAVAAARRFGLLD
ncbi:helix-turn-helix transcriptional regulator [Compostimonas suwonensis]|uniref:Regulatory LuxR family protein n=1 Tax=Compostimonas suwonensis TaxID=1048394 RepID=A0A2M9BCI6_9MICO|nr:helix-turn-helix transcriptional regulator [Compostimonas suwonensis]PJJ55669.1 regulatory LuxR family protein [Compostimonas suwonensis]